MVQFIKWERRTDTNRYLSNLQIGKTIKYKQQQQTAASSNAEKIEKKK